MNYKISHPTKVVECEIDLPSSKSISNRLLIIQALCKKHFKITNLSNSEDTIALQKALNSKQNTIDIGAAGTTFRFLTAYLSTLKGKEFMLTGSERMKQRPIQKLVTALNDLGATISYTEKEGFPPLSIKGIELTGGKITIDGSVSSQFISALLLIAPSLKSGLTIQLKGIVVSMPYIAMTLKLMQEFGIQYTWKGEVISIEKQEYIAKKIRVEADWSAASFWFEIAALSANCTIQLNGISPHSLQGDKQVASIFSALGVQSIFKKSALILKKQDTLNFPSTLDLLETPDLYQPLKCTLHAFSLSPEIKGLQTLKNKETDRVFAVDKELKNLRNSKKIETYKDHRMAMSFSPLCLKYDELTIKNIEVVSKSYPNFWKDLKKAGFKVIPIIH